MLLFIKVLSDGNLYHDGNYGDNSTANGLKYEHLKPGIRVHVILRAIEKLANADPNTPDIEFSNDFLNAANKDYYNLYAWLNIDKKKTTQFVPSEKELIINSFNLVNSSTSLYSGSDPSNTLYINSVNSSGFDRHTIR